MKKILTIIIVLISIVTYGQSFTLNELTTIKNADYTTAVEKLRNKGYIYVKQDDNSRTFAYNYSEYNYETVNSTDFNTPKASCWFTIYKTGYVVVQYGGISGLKPVENDLKKLGIKGITTFYDDHYAVDYIYGKYSIGLSYDDHKGSYLITIL